MVDLAQKRTIFAEEGNDASGVDKFKDDFLNHGGRPQSISDACIDMAPPFIKGIEDNFPNAEITFDKFHIMKILNNAVDEVRRAEVKEQDILRMTRYIWLNNQEDRTVAQRQILNAIESLPRLNLKTVRALHIRENFQEAYKEGTQEGFERVLNKWYNWATHSRIKPIKEAAKTIKRHWAEVIKWFESKISNGILESINPP